MTEFYKIKKRSQSLPVSNHLLVKDMVMLFIWLILSAAFVSQVAAQKLYSGFSSGGASARLGAIGHYDLSTGMLNDDLIFETEFDGASPTGSVIEVNGKLYGVTQSGGAGSAGVLFEWDIATQSYTKRVEFSWPGPTSPYGTLCHVNGKIYGTTHNAIFEWDLASTQVTVKVNLNANTGYQPYAQMTYVNGKFYGTCLSGGTSIPNHGYGGVIFEWDPVTNDYTKLHSFDFVNGASSYGSLTYYNGKFYGTTYRGGASDYGVLFEWDPATNSYDKKVDFTGPNGRHPMSGLTVFNGKLYGVAQYGGANHSATNADGGVLFEWNPSTGSFTKISDLTSLGIWYPTSNLTEFNGKLYGTGYSTVFEFDPVNRTVIRKQYFNTGAWPRGGMAIVNGTDFYGLGSSGGASGRGTLFKWTPSTNVFQNLMDFYYSPTGFNPNPRLHDTENGKIYGITMQGGPTNNSPAIFEFDPTTKSFTRKIQIPHMAPGTSLVNHKGGFLLTGYNSIYEWTPSSNTLRHKASFSGVNGTTAYSNVVAHAGKYYGTTVSGGGTIESPTNNGVIFEWDPESNIFTKKHDFDGASGMYAYGGLTYYNGKFYGTTAQGGSNGFGVIYMWDPETNDYTKLVDLGTNERHPYGGLTLFNDKLYGATYSGESSRGTLFEFDPATNSISKRITLFNPQDGYYPYGTTFIPIGGKLYAMLQGGLNNAGVIISWDPEANTFEKVADLGASSGHFSSWSQLLNYGSKQTQEITFADPGAKKYGDAPFLLQATSTSGLAVKFFSSNTDVARVNGAEVTIRGGGAAVITAYQDGDDIFYAADPVEWTITVAKAPLVVTAENKEREYGLVNPPFTLTYSGFVNGDDETSIGRPFVYSQTSQYSSVGEYPILLANGSSNKYTFEFVPGKLTIKKASLTARADNKSRQYGLGNPFFTISYSGFRNNDGPNSVAQPSRTTTAISSSPVGTYPITLTGGNALNYNLILEEGTLTVTKAPIIATPQSKTKRYLEENPPLTILYSGFRAGDNIQHLDEPPTASTTAEKESDVGVYDIVVTGGLDNNYAFTLNVGKLTITKALQVITFDELPGKTILDPTFEVVASASSGLPVSLATSDENIATVEGKTITIVDQGTVTITASQAGDHNYHPAPNVSRELNISGKQDQQIFAEELADDLFVGETVRLNAYSSSGLTLSYIIDDPSIGAISGDVVTLLRGGNTVITISQAGNDEYFPAEEVQLYLNVHSIEFASLEKSYCSESSFIISFDATGGFADDNRFTLEMSSASGSFDNPILLAETYGTSSGFFDAQMPAEAAQGSDYRMRIRSSAPQGVVISFETFTVDTPPSIVAITSSAHPVAVNNPVNVSVEFSDQELALNTIDWGDGSITSGSVSGSVITDTHVYTTAGVYTITGKIQDACGREAVALFQYVVIYDPYGGFVTGGGWFDSPQGAFVENPQATGKATFGFVSKYQKGSTVPTGNTDFQFHAGGMRFKSTSYEWLVIAGSKAMYKGVGDLNSVPGYWFMISAIDGDLLQQASSDKFRIKIWNSAGATIYDNQLGSADDAEATTVLGGGAIVIHEMKDKMATSNGRGEAGVTASFSESTVVSAYPNPFDHAMTVEYYSELSDDVEIVLLDVSGKIVYSQRYRRAGDGLYQVDFSAPVLRQMYFLKISQGRRVEYLKVMRR